MTSSVPPPPLDDPEQSDPMFCPPLKWGILGCGRVSHDFSQALKHLPTQSIVACSARSADSAEKFAEKHKIGKHYGSYDEMLKDPEVEIVYVGNIHNSRKEIGEKCLMHSKHVLLEKPFACSVKDGKYLISLAKERNLFIMEGMWTRFFPAVQKARDLAMGSDKVLGQIATVYSDFNFNAADSDAYPSSFLYQRKLGGGANLLVAPYPIAAASMFFDGRMPEDIKAVGQLPGSGVAMLSYGFLCETPEETVVVGSKGRMKIGSPGHCPTMLSIDLKADGRGNLGKTLNFEYPLPEDTKEIIDSGGYFYPNSAGFLYEAAAVARCIASGKREAPQFTLEETMLNLRVIEEIRNQLGVKAFDED
ncbi:NAD(P)-binding protein [Fragilariopsis cylindrus CCMP1102]|uniref:D-xylose 1-dehydrogenase (NADP(+), D-xylono-1,5-lactone-forming) n=1 Tax=Fragilariopsis cylindrus CCMP1102 TaxID=635003 RepID=A0A1E7FG76_9STRA|nr:NAD(P)-binding protein [Fragilariopsis cylindrus CCMP1102]|eukprot:OEU17178.1 NAD(P)-binding protein [Fragilariopsis cylindrus CCMP1102]